MLIATKVLAPNKFGGIENSELTQKSAKPKRRKLSKIGKLFKLQRLAKSKKPSKNGNLSNFRAKKARPSFLTFSAKEAFNHLWLTFTKAPILQHLDLKYDI